MFDDSSINLVNISSLASSTDFTPLIFQMFDWISHNKELFLQSHTEIGVSYQHALDLQTQHNHFAMNSMVSAQGFSLRMCMGWR